MPYDDALNSSDPKSVYELMPKIQVGLIIGAAAKLT